MAVRIRLKRLGKIRQPYYRIVITDARKKRDGRVIEDVGKYHPKRNPSFIEVDSERVQYWLGVGAQPSDPVMAILKLTGDWQTFKGLPAPEQGLLAPEAKPSKDEVFNAIAKSTAMEPPTPEGDPGKAKKSGKANKTDKAETAETAEKAEPAEASEPAGASSEGS